MGEIRIRAVSAPADCQTIVELQERVWGMPAGEVVPVGQLATAAKWGGTLLLASDGEKPVGFCYGFGGLDGDGGPVLCSHMLGVVESHRGRGLGVALKQRQRDDARALGLRRIVWTYDPLQARNAFLNLHRLGAISRDYTIDAYGPMTDELNRGLPTDRLLANWSVDAAPPTQPTDAVVVNPPQGERPGVFSADLLDGQRVRLAMPADVDALKRRDLGVVSMWRQHVREAFQAAFARGYQAVDVVPPNGGPTAWYVLTR
ncbi:MAG: GNAT family N-acetyltransferase [Egibacteraceae bacterium]